LRVRIGVLIPHIVAGCFVCSRPSAASSIDRIQWDTRSTSEVFDAWFIGLKDRTAKARIQARVDRAEDGNFGDCRPVGEGVSEMRIHHGPGYRLYFRLHGLELVVLLVGGNKSSQAADIEAALKLARKLKE